MNLSTLTFTTECMDCGRIVRYVEGQKRWHLCWMPPWLRGRVAKAYWRGYQFGRQEGRERDG